MENTTPYVLLMNGSIDGLLVYYLHAHINKSRGVLCVCVCVCVCVCECVCVYVFAPRGRHRIV